ncbi:MAG TPA: hypothetical protein VMR52_02370 [Dehalococcoidia bacterium]|nr:hypothetical protein [Dehalococcoidia bacterium]
MRDRLSFLWRWWGHADAARALWELIRNVLSFGSSIGIVVLIAGYASGWISEAWWIILSICFLLGAISPWLVWWWRSERPKDRKASRESSREQAAAKGYLDHHVDWEEALARLAEDSQWLAAQVQTLSTDMKDAAPRITRARTKGAAVYRDEINRMARKADKYSETLESRLPDIEKRAHQLRDGLVGWASKAPDGIEFRASAEYIHSQMEMLLGITLNAKQGVESFRKGVAQLRSVNATYVFNEAMDRLDQNAEGQIRFLDTAAKGYRKVMATIKRWLRGN